jgi:hypothetical protein
MTLPIFFESLLPFFMPSSFNERPFRALFRRSDPGMRVREIYRMIPSGHNISRRKVAVVITVLLIRRSSGSSPKLCSALLRLVPMRRTNAITPQDLRRVYWTKESIDNRGAVGVYPGPDGPASFFNGWRLSPLCKPLYNCSDLALQLSAHAS